MEELPFKRMRLRKKANREEAWPFSCEASSIGRFGALGSRFAMRWMKPMGAMGARVGDPTVAKINGIRATAQDRKTGFGPSRDRKAVPGGAERELRAGERVS